MSTVVFMSPSSGHSCPLAYGCNDIWCWDVNDISRSANFEGSNPKTVSFHPVYSFSTSGARGTRMLNGGRFYWEFLVSQAYGTSVMFGVGTKKARLHVDGYVDLLGEDNHSWGLNHRVCFVLAILFLINV